MQKVEGSSPFSRFLRTPPSHAELRSRRRLAETLHRSGCAQNAHTSSGLLDRVDHLYSLLQRRLGVDMRVRVEGGGGREWPISAATAGTEQPSWISRLA